MRKHSYVLLSGAGAQRSGYWESYDDVHRALAWETQLKGWTQAKKITLIVRRNPHWVDLAAEWYPWMREEGRDASTPQ
ncbi:MAG TPA: hypothetical protein VMS18_09095 [Candidatus Binatia bacterium]|nr:hypothetical protein [Candidatus Binatia bacterium]